MDKRKIMRIVVTTATCAAVLLPMLAFALPTVNPNSGQEITPSSIKTLIQDIATWLLGIAMVIAVIYMVVGGIMWITSRGDATKSKAATDMIKHAVYGVLVILAIGLILNTAARLVSSGTNIINQ